jgi:hypothetical protein
MLSDKTEASQFYRFISKVRQLIPPLPHSPTVTHPLIIHVLVDTLKLLNFDIILLKLWKIFFLFFFVVRVVKSGIHAS